jgi:hypothetical protein
MTPTVTETPVVVEIEDEIIDENPETEVFPALSDEEVHNMFMDEWERKFNDVEEDEEEVIESEEISAMEPVVVEEEQDFSTKEEETENIFHEEDYEGQTQEWLNETVSLPFATPEEVELHNIDGEPEPTPTETPNDEFEVTVEKVEDEVIEEPTPTETPIEPTNNDELPKDQPEEEKKNP